MGSLLSFGSAGIRKNLGENSADPKLAVHGEPQYAGKTACNIIYYR